jgi:putative flippase GtrA
MHVLAQWLRFAAVGVSNTLLSTAIFAALFHLGVPYLLGSALAFALGALNSYTLNRRWTFRSRGPRAPELARFLCVQAVGLGVNLGLLAGLVQGAGIRHVFAQLLAFPAASIITFALSRQWAFRSSLRPVGRQSELAEEVPDGLGAVEAGGVVRRARLLLPRRGPVAARPAVVGVRELEMLDDAPARAAFPGQARDPGPRRRPLGTAAAAVERRPLPQEARDA